HEAQVCMGLACEKLGECQEMVQWLEKAVEGTGGNAIMLSYLGRGYAVAGREQDARNVLQRLHEISSRQYVPAVFLGFVHMGLGENAAALDCLEKAVEMRDCLVTYAKVFPLFDPVRSEPRFQALLD